MSGDIRGAGVPPGALANSAKLYWARRIGRRVPIFSGLSVPAAPLGPATVVGPLLGNQRAWSLVTPSWTVENEQTLAAILAAYRAHAAAWPEHRIMFLCSAPAEVLRLQAHGVPAIFSHQNIMVSERRFAIDAAAEKSFDAVYVGKMAPYKRHHLASAVPSLALIYYQIDRGQSDYLAAVHAALPRAEFINETWLNSGALRLANPRAAAMARRMLAGRGYVVLPAEAVAATVNRARVGLCLSEEEGPMYAATEYLLCGLPVVTTPSRGGRDFFFDPEFTLTVDPDPEAVRDGVAELARRAVPAERIRAATLRRIAHERARLRAFLAALFVEEGIGEEFEESWAAMFRGPIWHWHSAETLLVPSLDPPATA